MSEAIKVVVRVRPMNQKENDRGCQSILKVTDDNKQLTICKPEEAQNVKTFAYDSVFSDTSKQSQVYEKTAFSLVQNVLKGYNGTIFAYGQTGCGKTHSMVGVIDVQQLQGIIPRSFGHILQVISQNKDKEYLIRCSFIEIYNEEVRDLLGKEVKKSLELKESPDKGVFVKDLSSNPAKTHGELMEYMNIGNRNRSVGETAMNKDSSRSHLLFMLYLESAEESQSEEKKYVASKLNLVDLAGSERINKTGAQGDRLQEAKNINLSLSALGNVISALVDAKSHHIPYRDSKLTRLLQDSLGGNTKTVMIANCSPADYNFDETLSSLRYASRAKFIKNKPIVNEDPKDALLKEYTIQIQRLKAMLGQKGVQGIIGSNMPEISSAGRSEASQQLRRKQQELKEQKEQKKMLMDRINMLKGQQLHGNQVIIDPKLKDKILKARTSITTQNQINSLKMQSVNQTNTHKTSKFNQSPLTYKEELKQLRLKVKGMETEVKDINSENYQDKQILLEDLRDLSKQNKLLEGILQILLSPNQFNKVKEVSEDKYNEERQKFEIPKFFLKLKDVELPKIKKKQEQNQFNLALPIQQNQKKKSYKNKQINAAQFEEAEKKIKQNNSIKILRQLERKNQSSADSKKKNIGKLIPIQGKESHSIVFQKGIPSEKQKQNNRIAPGAISYELKPNRKQLQPLKKNVSK